MDLEVERQELEDERRPHRVRGGDSRIEIVGSVEMADPPRTYAKDVVVSVEGVASGIGDLVIVASQEEVSTMDGCIAGLM